MVSERKNPYVEMIKEGLRIALFAGITALIGWLGQVLAGLDPNSTYVVIGTVVLRLIDKYIHENRHIAANGIAPF